MGILMMGDRGSINGTVSTSMTFLRSVWERIVKRAWYPEVPNRIFDLLHMSSIKLITILRHRVSQCGRVVKATDLNPNSTSVFFGSVGSNPAVDALFLIFIFFFLMF